MVEDIVLSSLQWRHSERDGVSNHQPQDCLLNCLFSRRSKKTSTFRVTGLCEGNSPVTGEFPAQRTSNAGNVSIWWRHHVVFWRHDMETLSTLLALSEWDPLVPSGFRATEKARDTELRYYFSLAHSLRQLLNWTNSRVADDLRPVTLTWCNGLVQRLEYLHC